MRSHGSVLVEKFASCDITAYCGIFAELCSECMQKLKSGEAHSRNTLLQPVKRPIAGRANKGNMFVCISIQSARMDACYLSME